MSRISIIAVLLLIARLATARPPDIEELTDKLSSTNITERLSAQTSILESGEKAIPHLQKLSKNADPQVRKTALSLIEQIEWKGIPESVIKRAKHFLNANNEGLGFKTLCEGQHGLRAALIVLDKLTSSRRQDHCRVFLKFFVDSNWAKDPSNFAKLSKSLRADLLSTLLQLEPYYVELASSWLRASHRTTGHFEITPALVRQSPRLVHQVLKDYITHHQPALALEFSEACSAIDARHLSAWADLFLKSNNKPDSMDHSLEQRVVLLRAKGRAKQALKLSKQLLPDSPIRQTIEELHGGLEVFQIHAETASAHHAMAKANYRVFLDFLKDPKSYDSKKLELDSASGTWFGDLEYLACFGDFEEILTQTADNPDRLNYWIEAMELNDETNKLEGLLTQPSKLNLQAAISLKNFTARAHDRETTKNFLIAFEATIPRKDTFARHLWAKQALKSGFEDLAYKWLGDTPKNSRTQTAYVLFPDQAKIAEFWSLVISPDSQNLHTWAEIAKILNGGLNKQQIAHYLKTGHEQHEQGILKNIACLSLLKGQRDPLHLNQRWAELRIIIKNADETEHEKILIETLIREARFWAEQGQHARAIECTEFLVKLQPQDPLAHLEHSLNLALAGKIKHSKKHSSLAGQLSLGQAQRYLEFAESFQARGMAREAAQAYDAILRFSRNDNTVTMKAIRMKAYQLAKDKKFAAAAQLRALELSKILTRPAKYRSLHTYAKLSEEFRKWKELAATENEAD